MTYKIYLPVQLSFILDQTELMIENLEDLENLQEKYDVDLQNIIDEYEYKLEVEENYLDEEDDSFGLNQDHILQTVIQDNIKDITDIFNKNVNLSYFDKLILDKIFTSIQNNFNNYTLPKYNINILSMEMIDYDIIKSSLVLSVDIDKELNKSELLYLKSEIELLCSDGWGKEIETIDYTNIIEEEFRYVYLKCWDKKTKIEII